MNAKSLCYQCAGQFPLLREGGPKLPGTSFKMRWNEDLYRIVSCQAIIDWTKNMDLPVRLQVTYLIEIECHHGHAIILFEEITFE